MGRLLICTLTGGAFFLLTSRLRADILFSQPVMNGGVALASDFGRFQQEADSFTLSQLSSVQTIHWWGAYANNDIRIDVFTLRMFSDTAGSPAITPFIDASAVNLVRTPTNLLDNLGDSIYEYHATLSNSVLFDAGTTYYLSIVNNTLGVWDWVGSRPGTHWARQDDASTWTASSNETSFAFELIGTPVPEPSTLLLLGIGVFGVIGWTRQRRRLIHNGG
jgi:hypothetical protein